MRRAHLSSQAIRPRHESGASQAATAEHRKAGRPTPEYSGQQGLLRHPDGRMVRLVDAPSVDVGGTAYRVDRRHPTAATVAIRTASRGEAKSSAEAQAGFDHLVEAVRDLADPMIGWKSFELFEGIRDYLDQRTARVNRTSQWAEVLQAMPAEDRVVRLERGLRALAKAFVGGKLPGVEAADLIDLAGRTQATAFNFDMDHNIVHLPGANYVLNRKTGEVKGFDHGEWAKMRHTVGQPGPLQDYKTLGSDLVFGSYQEADDGTDPDAYSRAVREALDGDPKDWQAPMWSTFQWALERPETAKNVFITTARGHFPRTIHNGMRDVLQAGGHIKHVPDEDHIFPVTASGIARTDDYSQEKVRFIRLSLDAVSAQPLGPASGLVRTADGRGSAMLHTLEFSDDDLRTARLVRDALHADQQAGRWPNVKVVVRFTATDHPDEPAWATVVGGAAGPRAATAEELQQHEGLRARQDRARDRMRQRLTT